MFGYSQPDLTASLKDTFSTSIRIERAFIRPTEPRQINQDSLTVDRLERLTLSKDFRKSKDVCPMLSPTT
ncbi:MAG: hypothetical protein COB86_08345 [Dehalococcoidia bacterium]|nr:MAG: hypothetical protein COB86_08345 [Dehalococcoidia bacterium]